MSERDLQKDLEICEKATSGIWGWYPFREKMKIDPFVYTGSNFIASNLTCLNAEFIAESRQGWPYAIQRAIVAEERIVELENWIKQQSIHVSNMQKRYNLSPDCGYGDLAKIRKQLLDRIAELEKALEEIDRHITYDFVKAYYILDIAQQVLKGGGKQ